MYLGFQEEPFQQQFWSHDLSTGESRQLTHLDIVVWQLDYSEN